MTDNLSTARHIMDTKVFEAAPRLRQWMPTLLRASIVFVALLVEVVGQSPIPRHPPHSIGLAPAGLHQATALLQQFVTVAYERAASDKPLTRPLLMVLDEAANIAPMPDLDTLASTAAGVGIQLVTVWQDLAQIHNRYGDRSATVVNNHRAKIALSGISDPRTLEFFSRLAGDSEIARSSTTTDASGQISTTDATQYRRLASDDALRQMSPGEGLLLYGYLPPVCLRLRPWFADRHLRAKTEASTAGVPNGSCALRPQARP